ncbi:MAG: hypothetical protein JSS49_18350 [Planctomycetes bacterium]|nr:hypothetical protein [Planctomycetota bacterium]
MAVAGGLPPLMTQDVELAAHFVELCDGILLTGGDDPMVLTIAMSLEA